MSRPTRDHTDYWEEQRREHERVETLLKDSEARIRSSEVIIGPRETWGEYMRFLDVVDESKDAVDEEVTLYTYDISRLTEGT